MNAKKKPGKLKSNGNNPTRQLRIIAGAWRGSKLSFIDADGVRPTGDRIRETLFNWLSADIDGAHCLDMYAGSGALAFEALSRGAASAVAIDSSRAAAASMREAALRLGAAGLEVQCTDALAWLQRIQPAGHRPGLDIVFIDPPFNTGKVPASIAALDASGLLARDAIIYVEQEIGACLPEPPPHWQLCKNQSTGQVRYLLYRTLKPAI